MTRWQRCAAAALIAAAGGCGAAQDSGEEAVDPGPSWNVQAAPAATSPAATSPSTSSAEYDFSTDPQFSFDERVYLIAIDMDPVSGPGSNLELSRDRFGSVGADLLVRRGRLACDAAEAGLPASENINKSVQFGGLTPAEAQLVLNAAVTTLCPEYISSGT